MNRKQAENWTRTQNRLMELGISRYDIEALFRIERTLSRWAEGECNGDIQREGDDGEGKPYRVWFAGPHQDIENRYAIPDRERGALKRLAAIMAKYPELRAYHQGDPRGCALYVVPLECLKTYGGGADGDISQVYNRGVAVCY